MTKSYSRGHEIWYDETTPAWRYADNNELISDDRPCVRCGKSPTSEGHDACIGHLNGVVAACCGHGVEEGYIVRG